MCAGLSLAYLTMSSGSTSTGSYPSLYLVTALSPCDPWGRYESRLTQQKASRWTQPRPRYSAASRSDAEGGPDEPDEEAAAL